MTSPSGSARVGKTSGDLRNSTPEELDQMARSTKKVKTTGDELTVDDAMPQVQLVLEEEVNFDRSEVGSNLKASSRVSYRDKVVEGEGFNQPFSPQEILEAV